MSPPTLSDHLQTLMDSAVVHMRSVAGLQRLFGMSDAECRDALLKRLERDRARFDALLRAAKTGRDE